MPDATPNCPACQGEGCLLGTLGASAWFRCRRCGMDFRSAALAADGLPASDDGEHAP